MGAPFISTTELSEAMGGTDTATARGTAVITAACDMVRLATEQQLYPTVSGGTAILDGTGTDCLLLPERPVASAGTVIESGGTLTLGTDYVLSGNGELYRKPGVIDSGWSTIETRTYWWPGRQNVEVTYDHGYTTLTIPDELKEVAIQMAKRLHSSRDGSVVFEQLGQRSIRYGGSSTDWTGTEKIVLDKYRQAK